MIPGNRVFPKRLTAGVAASVIFLILAGVSPWSLSLALLLPALLTCGISPSWASYSAVAVAAAAGLSGGGPQGESLVLVSSMIGLTCCHRTLGRLAIAVPLAVLIAWGSLPGTIPLAIGAAAAVVTNGRTWRLVLMTAGVGVCLLFIGLPGTVDHGTRTARSMISGDGAAWPDTVSILNSSPGLELDLSAVTGMDVSVQISAGGQRSSEAAGYILLGSDTVFTLMPGDSTFTLTASGGSATIVQARGWKPFNHPVIRFCGAKTVWVIQ